MPITVGSPITFTDTSTNLDSNPIYYWDFGDGTTGTGKIVQHTFNIVGNYDVFHTVTNGCGTSSSTVWTMYVVPICITPTCSFIMS